MDKKTKPKSSFPKLENLISECLERLINDWPKLIGHDVQLEFVNYECIQSMQLPSIINNSDALLEIALNGKISGKFYIQFSIRDAIIISGLTLMEDKPEIEKHISESMMNADYTDAFKEFGNQSCASFDIVFRSHISEEIHTKFSQFLPPPMNAERLQEIFPEQEIPDIFVVNSKCTLWDFDKGNFRLLFSLELAEGFFDEAINLSEEEIFSHILIIDDSKTDIAVIKRYLRKSGYQVHACADAATAFSILQHERISVIILDIYLKELDGFAICRQIKRNMLLDQIPIIMCSAMATKENVINAIRTGASDFLVKPFKREHLITKLAKYISKRGKNL